MFFILNVDFKILAFTLKKLPGLLKKAKEAMRREILLSAHAPTLELWACVCLGRRGRGRDDEI